MPMEKVIVTIENEKVEDVAAVIESLTDFGLSIETTQKILSSTYVHGWIESEESPPVQHGVHWEKAGWQGEI
ncbi:MAG: hypothetical protein AAF483_24405 [Planctomycetota bacterium]